MKREVNIDAATLRFSSAQRETLVVAIESLQSCLCIGKAYSASAGVVGAPGRQSSAVIADNQVKMLILLFCLDRDEPGAPAGLDTVADGVLDQRLKNESWNQRFHEFSRNA